MKLRQLYLDLKQSFKDISDSPDSDARIIICHCLSMDNTAFALAMEEEVPDDKLKTIKSHGKRRQEGEPVAYITGERGFYECVFKVSPATLIPRADTETLVEDAIVSLTNIGDKEQIKIVDLCCGTGCIGISVAKVLSRTFKRVCLTLSDISEEAMEICRQNVQNLITEKNIEVVFRLGDLFETIADTDYDAILSNPPYIQRDIIPTLEKQVQFEPKLALDGGEDGLDIVRRIAEEATRHLAVGGLLEMEIGHDQAADASIILAEEGYSEIAVIQDLGGNDRVVKGRK